MLDHINPFRVLFFDIETVPMVASFEELDEEMQLLWKYKTDRFKPTDISDADYFFKKAGVYAEFGKIVCISAGFFTRPKEEEEIPLQFRIKSFYGDDEQEVLTPFLEMLMQYFHVPTQSYLCGHNITEFDVPFICRRAVIHGLKLPNLLDVNGLKPWEHPFLDTMRLWKFGDYKNFTSLRLLTKLMGVPSPKNDMEGSMVASVYWQDQDLPRIHQYCQQDVVALAQLLLRFRGEEMLGEEQVVLVS